MVQYPAEQDLGTMLTENFGSVPVRASHRSMPSCMTSLSLSGDAVPMQTPLKEKEEFPKLEKLQRLFDEDCASTTYLSKNSLAWKNSITLIRLGFWTLQSFVLCVKIAAIEADNKEYLINISQFVQVADKLRCCADQVACSSTRYVGQVANKLTPPSSEHLTIRRSQPPVFFIHATFSTSILQPYSTPSSIEQPKPITLHVQNAYFYITVEINDHQRYLHSFQLGKSSLIRHRNDMSTHSELRASAMEIKPQTFSINNPMASCTVLNPRAVSFTPCYHEQTMSCNKQRLLDPHAPDFVPESCIGSAHSKTNTLLNCSVPESTPVSKPGGSSIKTKDSCLNARASLFVPGLLRSTATAIFDQVFVPASAVSEPEFEQYESENSLFAHGITTIRLPDQDELQNDFSPFYPRYDDTVPPSSFDVSTGTGVCAESVGSRHSPCVIEFTSNTGQFLKRTTTKNMPPSSYPHEKYEPHSEMPSLTPDQRENQRQKFKIDWMDALPHHFSWTGEPVLEKCQTPAALSLAIIQSFASKPKGLAFGHQNSLRTSCLMKKALPLIDPVVFIGESKDLKGLTGSELQDAAIGQTFKLYSPHGWWHDEEYETYFNDDEEPFMDHLESASYDESDLIYNGWHENHGITLREDFITAEHTSNLRLASLRKQSVLDRMKISIPRSCLNNVVSRNNLSTLGCLDPEMSPSTIMYMDKQHVTTNESFVWADEADEMDDDLVDFDQKLKECLTMLTSCGSSEYSGGHEKCYDEDDLPQSIDVKSTAPTEVDTSFMLPSAGERAHSSEQFNLVCLDTEASTYMKDEQDFFTHSGSQFNPDSAVIVELLRKDTSGNVESEGGHLIDGLEASTPEFSTPTSAQDDDLLSSLESFSPIKPALLQDIVNSACSTQCSAKCITSIESMSDDSYAPIPFSLRCSITEPFSVIDWNHLQTIEPDSELSQQENTERLGFQNQNDTMEASLDPESIITPTKTSAELLGNHEITSEPGTAALRRTGSSHRLNEQCRAQRMEDSDAASGYDSDNEDEETEIRQYIAEMNRKLDEIEHAQQLSAQIEDMNRPKSCVIQQSLRCGTCEVLPAIQASPVKASRTTTAILTTPVSSKRRQISDPTSLLAYRRTKTATTTVNTDEDLYNAVLTTELEVPGEDGDDWADDCGLLPTPQLPTFKSIRTAPSMRQRISKLMGISSLGKSSFTNQRKIIPVKTLPLKSIKKSIKGLFKQEVNVLH